MRNWERIFNPKTVALVGATERQGSVGRGIMENLLLGRDLRKIYPVNPNRKEVFGLPCLPSLSSIPQKIDLVLIAIPAFSVKKVVEECCQKKVGGIIIISAGFKEKGGEGKRWEEEIARLVKKAKIPLLGPNCLGIIRPKIRLNASFSPLMPKKGEIAFISQSGALIDSVIDRSISENYGFSTIISYGNEADLTLSDFLEFAGQDKETKVIAIYLEGVKDGQKFMKVAKKIKKPIVALKAGKTEKGKKAVQTHTGSLAGNQRVYSAVFKQTGIIEVETLEELFDIGKAVAWQRSCKNGIGIITNGGGAGVLLTDYCQELGIKLPKLKKETLDILEKSGLMHHGYSKRNPLDIIGDASFKQYQIGIEALLSQKDIYGLIVIQTLQSMTNSRRNAEVVVWAKKKWKEKPIVCCFLGGEGIKEGAEVLAKHKIPNYSELKRAAKAMWSLIEANKK